MTSAPKPEAAKPAVERLAYRQNEIARRTNSSILRVEYVIRSRGIKPQGRAGNACIFSESDVELIANELHRIDSKLSNGGAQ